MSVIASMFRTQKIQTCLGRNLFSNNQWIKAGEYKCALIFVQHTYLNMCEYLWVYSNFEPFTKCIYITNQNTRADYTRPSWNQIAAHNRDPEF